MRLCAVDLLAIVGILLAGVVLGLLLSKLI